MKLLLATVLFAVTASADAATIWCKLSKTDSTGQRTEATKSVEIANGFSQAIVTLENVTLTGSAAQLNDGTGYYLWGIRSNYSSGQGMDVKLEGPITEQYVGLSNGITGVCRVNN